jgi:two-component system, OmpR family, response regulator
MLVLSRRTHEKILFPGLNITVEVVSIKSGSVRLGITAPPEVPVLRGELPDRVAEWGPAKPQPARPDAESRLQRINRLIGNRLRINRMGLAEVRRQVRLGRPEEAEMLLGKIEEDVQMLERRLEGEIGQARPRPRGPNAVVVQDSNRQLGHTPNRLRPATASRRR